MRSDTDRNRRRLVAAAGVVVARRGRHVKMADIAEEADVSAATGYRHFGSVDEVLAEFRYGVGRTLLEYSDACEEAGLGLLRAVSRRWVELVVAHGAAMIHTRSEIGYLERLRAGATYVTVQADALRRPIAEAAAELGVPDPAEHGIFLWNLLFDPREITDLITTVGLTEEQVSRRLVGAFCAAVAGWRAGPVPNWEQNRN